MGNSIFGASVSLRIILGNNRELRRQQEEEARRALVANIAMQHSQDHHQPVEYASILQGIMTEVSTTFATNTEERSRNASRIAAMHGDHDQNVFAGVDQEPDEDEIMASRGRSIFYSLRVTATNHLPRLLREVARLTQDCELLSDLTWRDHMSYKEMCTCVSSIEDLKRLAEVMIQAGSEQVVKEQVDGRVKSSVLKEHEQMVVKMHAFAAVMDEYYKNAMENVNERGRELSRKRRKREMIRGNLGDDSPPSSSPAAPTCVLCCDEEPVGQDKAWVVCTNCGAGFCDKVCWTCTLKLFQMESAPRQGADCPFCRNKLEFAKNNKTSQFL